METTLVGQNGVTAVAHVAEESISEHETALIHLPNMEAAIALTMVMLVKLITAILCLVQVSSFLIFI